MIKLDSTDKKIVNKLILVSMIGIIVLGVFKNSLNDYKLFLLYILCIIVGAISIKYTFVIMILSYTNVFSLFNGINMSGNMTDFGLIAVISCFIIQTIKYVKRNKYKCSKKLIYNALYVISIILLLSTSILVANIRYGQPLIRGILSFRYLLVLVYIFPFVTFLRYNKNGKEIVMDYLTKMVCISIILLIIQNVVKSDIEFLKLFRATRNGTERVLLHTVSPLYCIVFAYNINILIENKKVVLQSVVTIILIFIAIFIISQTRIYMAAIIGILTFDVYLIKDIKFVTRILLTFILLSCFIVLLLSNFIPQLFTKLFSDVTSAGKDYVRNKSIKYYFEEIDDNMFIFGGGITNEKYEKSPILKGEDEGLFLVDIGIFGVFFEFGILEF